MYEGLAQGKQSSQAIREESCKCLKGPARMQQQNEGLFISVFAHQRRC